MNDNRRVQNNMIWNMVRTLSSIIFPLISYPYITRVLGVDNYGKVNFSSSVISYFALFASLGINTYAIRESGLYRKDKKILSQFLNEVFSFNVITTLMSISLLIISCFLVSKFHEYRLLLLIQSMSIFAATFGFDYINTIFEDFKYITLRGFIFQLVSLVLMLVLVKSPSDYFLYAFLQILGNILIAFTNQFYITKYVRPRFTFKMNLSKHAKPVIILFANSLAISIYLNCDKLMLGWMTNDYFVGTYSAAVTIYSVLKQLLAALYTVTVTRLTEYIASGDDRAYDLLVNDVLNKILFLSLPIVIGGLCVTKDIVLVAFGYEYIDSVAPLRILTLAIPFAVIGGALSYCINMPHKLERITLTATVFSACINVGLNFLFIKFYYDVGASITTFISELLVCIMLGIPALKRFPKIFSYRAIGKNILKTSVASIPIIVFSYLFESIGNVFIKLGLTICLSLVSFILINILLKNVVFTSLIKENGRNNTYNSIE